MNHFWSRNRKLLIFSGIAAVFFSIVFCSSETNQIGAWGDFLGAAIATIAFFWLIAGHFENQREIASTNNQMAEQLQLLRGAVQEMGTIAGAVRILAAHVLAEAQPILRSIPERAIGHNTSYQGEAIPVRASWVFQNDGEGISIVSCSTSTSEVAAAIQPKDALPHEATVSVELTSAKPLRPVLPVTVFLVYENRFNLRGYVAIECREIGQPPIIKYGMGEPPG